MITLERKTEGLEKLAETEEKFLSEIVDMTRKEAYDYYKKSSYIGKYNTEETKEAFSAMNADRCSFCTKYISDFHSLMTVEHIELKKDVPSKIFCWQNLLCACRACNTKRSIKPYDSSRYIDPTKVQEVERYFKFQADGTVIPSTFLSDEEKERANYMIDMYGLNRKDLVCERRKFYMDLLKPEYYNILCREEKDSQNIIFLDVFVYHKRRKEKNGQ